MENYAGYDQPFPHPTDVQIASVEPELKVPNKGNLFQFLRDFPEDRYLNHWVDLIRANQMNSTGVTTD